MLSARISSYGYTWEVWRAREKRTSCLRRSREQLLLLQCSRNSIIAEWRIGNPLNGFLSFFFFFIFLFYLLLLFFFPGRTFFLFLFLFFREERQKHFCAPSGNASDTIVASTFSPTVGKPPIPACTSKQNVLNLKAHLPFGILTMS